MELLLIPLILFIAAVIFYINFRKVKKQFDNISRVERSTAAEVRENHEHFLIEFGPGTFQYYAELNGMVKCDAPLTAPISGRTCVYAEHKILRKYETMVQVRDSQGRMVNRMESRTETISSGKQSVPFRIEDEGSAIDIMPESADFFPVQSHHSQNAYLDPTLSGNLGISTGFGMGNTTGYVVSEYIIPVEQPLYVLGEANDRNGKLAVSKPRDKAQSFILSTSHEDVLLQKLGVKVRWFRIGFWAGTLSGLGSLAFILLQLIKS